MAIATQSEFSLGRVAVISIKIKELLTTVITNFAVWGISQAFGLVALGLVFYAFQVKSRVKTLTAVAVGCIFLAISTAILGNWVVTGLLLVAVGRSFTFAWFEKNGKPTKTHQYAAVGAMALFITLSIIVVIFTWEWWFDWLVLAASCLIVWGNWAKGIHPVRIAGAVGGIIHMANHIIFMNIMGTLIELSVLISIIAFYIIKKPYKDVLKNKSEFIS